MAPTITDGLPSEITFSAENTKYSKSMDEIIEDGDNMISAVVTTIVNPNPELISAEVINNTLTIAPIVESIQEAKEIQLNLSFNSNGKIVNKQVVVKLTTSTVAPFEFNEKETVNKMPINKEGYIKRETVECLNNSNIINLSFDLFKDDALVFNDLKSNKISLKSVNHDRYVTMDFTGFPYMGLWTKPIGAPFVCIEPWYGHADFEDFDGELKDKDGIQKLEVGEVFNASYTVTVK